MKLRKKFILILILLSILPVSIMGGIALINLQDTLVQNIGFKSLDFSDIVGRSINEKLFSIFEHLLTWSEEEGLGMNSPDTDSINKNAVKYLKRLNQNFNFFNYLALSDIKGNLIATSKPKLFSVNTTFSGQLDFEKALSGVPGMSEPSFDPFIKKYSLNFFIPVRNFSDYSIIDGVFIASLNWDYTRNMITSLKIRGKNPNVQNHVMLTTKNGLVISGDADDNLFKDNLITGKLQSAILASQQKEGYMIEVSEHHYHSFSTYNYLKNYEQMPNPGWLIIIIQDYESIFAPIKNLQITILIIAIVLIFLLSFIAYYIGKRITEPILNMTENARAIGAGDLTRRISVDSSDEIGELAKSFNNMAENLLMSKKELTRSTRYNTGIINSMSDSLMIISEEKIKEVNQATLNLLGYKHPEELIGKGINTIISMEEKGEEKKKILQVLIQKNHMEHEFYYKTKSGKKIPVLIGWAQLEDSDYEGKKIISHEFIFIGRDITVRKKMEDDLRNSRLKAIEANRAKSVFLSNMSHEIRTPLNGIMGITSLLADIETSDEKLDYLKMIQQSSKDLLMILNDLLDLSKIESGKIRFQEVEFNLYEMMEETITTLAISADSKGLHLIWSLSPDITSFIIKGDATRLRQVIINLVGNSIKFTEMGEIEVKVRPSAYTPSEDRGFDNTIQFIFSVCDTGIGIEKKRVDRIFESFYQIDTDDSRKNDGVGLGLSICKQIVELMGGRIWVESEPGFGSTFYFTANFKQAVPEEKTISDKKADFIKDKTEIKSINNKNIFLKKSASILIVEDKRINQIVVSKLLERRGYSVRLANNGKEAISTLEQAHYDLILMDIRMPEMDGLEATRIIRASDSSLYDSEIPIVAMSAYAMSEDREKCFNAGMNEHLSKPIDKETLYHVIDKILEKNSEL